MKYADFKDDFVNKIGKYNVSILNDISDLYIYDFGIFIEVAPDEEQKAQLEQNIQMALSKGDINLEDAIDIREIKNLKLANQLLKLKRKQKQEREDTMAMQKQPMTAQLRGVSEQALAFREGERDTAKKDRISQQNTQQSKLINQRKNNLPPQNFESNEDSLDGFDLAEFDPR